MKAFEWMSPTTIADAVEMLTAAEYCPLRPSGSSAKARWLSIYCRFCG